MANQKVCDGCGIATPSKDARGEWARIHVPSAEIFPLRDSDYPELDLCPDCFLGVLSLMTAFNPSVAE